VWGSAGRVVGSEGENAGAEEKILAPAGVGVKGGGLSGDSDDGADFDAALRFLGIGVAGRDEGESAKSTNLSPLVLPSTVTLFFVLFGADVAVVLRFFVGALALLTFSYFATPSRTLASDRTCVLLLATRAERLKDMV